MSRSRDEEHALYRFFDAGGDLLYIGLTVSLPVRLVSHRDGRPWWREVASMTVQWLPDRDAVIEAERLAIINERPRYNVVHNLARRGSTGTRSPAAILEYAFGDFDHSAIARLPEYGILRAALNELALKSDALSDDEWVRAASDMVATTPHADTCRQCQVMNWPHRIEASESDAGFRAWYRCVRCQDRYEVAYYAYEQPS